ncbi:phosphate acyltransferase PlsX [Acholeplasma sp. OttesenSCG-928-E16]|nr:phosphate acyltransferase PlsX [Acholeplasma sp. OttesenSCG-928-E16]
MKVIIDTLGGDKSASEFVSGAIKALDLIDGLELVFAGRKLEIEEALGELVNDKRISLLDCSEEITNDDQPTTAIRQKKDSSLVKSLELLASDSGVDAMISSGNTGAVLFGGMTKIGRIEGIDRAALAPILPTLNGDGRVCLIDSGANVDCKPEMLGQFAIMGSSYMKSTMKIENPRVALISVGTEDKKGNEQTKAAFEILKNMPINFVGNMEARDALSGKYDVLVCDGFIGNVLLKSIEGAAVGIMKLLGKTLNENLPLNTDPTFIKKSFGQMMALLDFNSNGGATLLGINKIVIKVHGAATSSAVTSAIFQVKDLVDGRLVETTKDLIQKSLEV